MLCQCLTNKRSDLLRGNPEGDGKLAVEELASAAQKFFLGKAHMSSGLNQTAPAFGQLVYRTGDGSTVAVLQQVAVVFFRRILAVFRTERGIQLRDPANQIFRLLFGEDRTHTHRRIHGDIGAAFLLGRLQLIVAAFAVAAGGIRKVGVDDTIDTGRTVDNPVIDMKHGITPYQYGNQLGDRHHSCYI